MIEARIFRRFVRFLPVLLLPHLVFLAGGTPIRAEGARCTIHASCCSAEASCTAHDARVCSAVCSPAKARCECHCETRQTDGGTTCGGEGGTCCEGVPVEADKISLHGLLSDLGERSGMKFIAPTLDPKSIVSVHAGKMGFGDWVNEIAGQLQTVPVYRAKSGVIELVARPQLSDVRFSEEPLTRPFDAKFLNTEVGRAIRLIGEAAGIDIAVPGGLTGRVTGDFPALGWKASLEAVLAAS